VFRAVICSLPSKATGLLSLYSGYQGIVQRAQLYNLRGCEFGHLFCVSEAGLVTAIRFYKVPKETTGHTGKIWTANGTLLGSVAFASETASGWQQANFATAIPVSAGQDYILTVNSPASNGYRARAQNPPAQPFVNGPLSSVFTQGYGIYSPSPGTAPSISNQSDELYFRDLVFVPTALRSTTVGVRLDLPSPLGLLRPVASPPADTYPTSVAVALSRTTGDSIRYTLDGSDPTAAATLYTAPFTLTQNTTLRARVFLGSDPGPDLVADYVLQTAAPVLSPPAGNYPNSVTISASSATPGATLRFVRLRVGQP
jgi:hypothetical protein